MSALAILLMFAQQATGTISGTVSDSVTHLPIPRARVRSTDIPDEQTGADGSYTITQPGAGEVHVGVEAAGCRPQEATARIAEGGLVKLDFDLHPMARLTGRIIDKDTGEPIQRFVLLSIKKGRSYMAVAKPKDGAFEIAGLEPGDYTLRMLSQGDIRVDTGSQPQQKPHGVYGDVTYPATIHVEEGQQQFLDIRLPAVESHRVAGIVEMPAGNENKKLGIGIRHGNSNSSVDVAGKHPGPFSIEGLTPGEYTFTIKLGKALMSFMGSFP